MATMLCRNALNVLTQCTLISSLMHSRVRSVLLALVLCVLCCAMCQWVIVVSFASLLWTVAVMDTYVSPSTYSMEYGGLSCIHVNDRSV